MKTIPGFIYFIVCCSVLNAQTLTDAIRMTENEQFESANKVFENLVIAEPTNGNYFY
ncbi:MAG: hypothetical protein JNL63_11220, partial [Bacteroidia bacterium]|nr:hypothetical protein [Bacteroidia bacterium]